MGIFMHQNANVQIASAQRSRARFAAIRALSLSAIAVVGSSGNAEPQMEPMLASNLQNPSNLQIPSNLQNHGETTKSLSSSKFTILRPANIPASTDRQSARAVRPLPAIPTAYPLKAQQDFLEDIPPPKTNEDQSLVPPRDMRRPTPSKDSELQRLPPTRPAPVEDPEPIAAREQDENSLLPAPSAKMETQPKSSADEADLLDGENLLEQRQKAAVPYPAPDFSTPAEKVVPLPTRPAPNEFKGFEPPSSGDWTLPEPRRIFPLPKIEVPGQSPQRPLQNGQSQNSQPPSPLMTDGPQAYELGAFPESSGMSYPRTYANDPQFQPLMRGSVRPKSLGGQSSTPSLGRSDSSHLFDAGRTSLEPHPFRERLNSKRWQLQLAQQLPTSTSPSPLMADGTCAVPYQPDDFAPIPYTPKPLDPSKEIDTYYAKLAVDTQRPWVEWWRPFYTGGMYDPGVPVFSDVNLLTPSFLVYGDYRTGVGVHRDRGQNIRNWAHRLNLDMDMRFTATERFHLFTGPLDHNGRFTRLDFSNNNVEFEEELDAQAETAFFEGDLGAITGSLLGEDAPFDLPFTCGLVPLLYQNGIWMEDAIAGFAFGSPWRHNRALNWSNYEATFFAGFNNVTSPAFQNDNNAATVYGTAWFVEAYGGYIEMDYAFLDDLDRRDRSYHNAAIAFTRRYFGRISNTVRLIGNIGQQGPQVTRSADGALLLFENSLISSEPSTLVPYWNCFLGNGTPQSVARAGNAGGILRNTGINFETDALTGYPTLNATASNSYGGAVGLNLLSADFRKQWIVEFAALDTYGDPALSAAAGPEYALGTRYQTALNNRIIWRMDLMNGWFDNAPDIYGTRTELRWKF